MIENFAQPEKIIISDTLALIRYYPYYRRTLPWYQDLTLCKQVDKIDPIRSKFGKIQKEEISLEDCMAALDTYARSHKYFSFRGLLEQAKSKTEIIVTFLAILELMKLGTIRITQEAIFDDIQITSQVAA